MLFADLFNYIFYRLQRWIAQKLFVDGQFNLQEHLSGRQPFEIEDEVGVGVNDAEGDVIRRVKKTPDILSLAAAGVDRQDEPARRQIDQI